MTDGGAQGTGNDSSSDAEKGPGNGSHSPESATTPANTSDSSNSLLTPPSNLSLRRGSAPSLGLASSPVSSSTSSFRIHSANPLNTTRSTTDSIRPPAVANPLNPFDGPSAAMLARRQSLPSMHPAFQKSASQATRLPTVADIPHSPETDASFKSPDQTSTSNESGHGGVYRSASSTRLGSMPYPPPSRPGPNYAYRSGSTPGTGVFRIPANPNPPQPSAWGLPGTAQDDGSGLKISAVDTINQPYSFPPRPYSNVPGAGPLPSKDFRFGDAEIPSRDGNSSGGSGGNDEEEERRRLLAHRSRFGSFASDLSVESDATGTTATTATSSTGYSPVVNPFSAGTTAPSGAFRPRYPGGLGLRPSFGHANTDMGYGSSISYGIGSGSVAGILGLNDGPVQFPPKFDPESRRASWSVYLTSSFRT